MTKEQIQDYLIKYRLKTKEDLAEHIEQLKRNTKPNLVLISELSYVLVDEENLFFNVFSREKEITGRRIKPFFLDEVLEQADLKTKIKTGESEDFLTTTVFVNTSEKDKKAVDELQKLINSHKYKQNTDRVKDILKNYNTILKSNNFTGEKTNKNKPQISLLFIQFPKALEAISKCSEYGHEKYKETDSDYLNYQRVEGGSKTYADAGLRHRLEQGNDLESRLPHEYHVAWNALAELELWIKENN